jgi:hypothetical protein
MDTKQKKNYKPLTLVLSLNGISFIGNGILFALTHTNLAWINFGAATLSGIMLVFIFVNLDAYIREK